MNRLLLKIDKLIDQIPSDIKDLIQKMAIAIGAVLVLLGVISAVIRGTRDAKPAGFQVAEESNDLFYLDQIKEENSQKLELIEDVEYDIESLTGNQFKEDKIYRPMSEDTLDHLKGETDSLILPIDELRSQHNVPSFIDTEENAMLKRPNEQKEIYDGKLSKKPMFDLPSFQNDVPQVNQYKNPITTNEKIVEKMENKRDLVFIE